MIQVDQASIDAYTAKGWWGHTTLGEMFLDTAARQPMAFAVADAPNRPALFGGVAKHWSWAELCVQTGTLCALLDAQGLHKDDVLIVQLPNCVELHALYLACAIMGVMVSPVPMQYRAHELEYVAQATQAKGLISTQRLGSYLAAQAIWSMQTNMPSVQWIWAYGDGSDSPLPAGVAALNQLVAATVPWTEQQMRTHMQRIGLTANDVFTICWTSGTEARAKGVPRSHNQWLVMGESVIDAAQLPHGTQMVIPFPFVNMAGISTSLVAWLMTGGGLYHHHPFDLQVFLQQLQEHRVDYTVAAPAVLSMLLKSPHLLEGIDLQRLTRVGSGGGPVAPWLFEQFAQRFGIEVINYFGSNEGASLASTPQDVPDQQQRANFFPRIGVPGLEWQSLTATKIATRLVDLETGQEISESGQVGELRFKGPMIFSGYYNSPQVTTQAFDEQGYYRSGDLFEIAGERQQFYRFAGRHKDIVVRGGMNISCEEVENLLLSHPKVREVAVIGWPDEILGERVCAVVVPSHAAEPVSLDELVVFLKTVGKVAAFKLPERMELTDALPRNPVGKVLKRVLREQVQSAAAQA